MGLPCARLALAVAPVPAVMALDILITIHLWQVINKSGAAAVPVRVVAPAAAEWDIPNAAIATAPALALTATALPSASIATEPAGIELMIGNASGGAKYVPQTHCDCSGFLAFRNWAQG